MEWKLVNGDYVPDGMGGLTALTGGEEVLARTLYRLTARRGGLPFRPELGSRLYQLRREKPSARQALAAQYVAEALADEDVAVTGVELDREGEGRLLVHLLWQRQEMTAAVTVGGTE